MRPLRLVIFVIDNLHLVNRAQHDGTAQVAPTTVTFSRDKFVNG